MMKFMIRLLAFLCAVLMVISLGITTVGYAFATSTDIANEVEENFIEEPPEAIMLGMTEEIDIPKEDPNESKLIAEAVLDSYGTADAVETFGYDFEEVCEIVTAQVDDIYDFDYLTEIVTAEAGSVGYDLCSAIAQCIQNGCIKENCNPLELCKRYGYASSKGFVVDFAYNACADILVRGITCNAVEDALYFYSAELCHSDWHESMRYICTYNMKNHCWVDDPYNTIGGIRFFGDN